MVEFDSAATAGEVIKTIKAKIGMRSDAECFAIYEVMSSSGVCRAVQTPGCAQRGSSKTAWYLGTK